MKPIPNFDWDKCVSILKLILKCTFNYSCSCCWRSSRIQNNVDSFFYKFNKHFIFIKKFHVSKEKQAGAKKFFLLPKLSLFFFGNGSSEELELDA